MVINQRWIKFNILFFIPLFFVLQLVFSNKVFADVDASIDASVKLSLCGDGVVEGSEDCEPQYLETFQCSDLGSYTGTTTCDIGCEYDMLNCTPVIPPDPPDPPVDEEDDGEEVVDEEPQTLIPTVIKDIAEAIEHLKIPEIFRIFDIDKDGVLKANEYISSITYWVKNWKVFSSEYPVISNSLSCDINGDKLCNFVDLSILLYYSE